ncbi:hypothetical protein GCM10020255_079190 [Rhodococcus baikonurensis]
MAVLSAERIKITTTKSPLWCTITIIVLGLGVAWMIGRSSSSSIQAYNDEAASGTPDFEKFLPTFNDAGLGVSGFGVMVLMIMAALAITSEYRFGIIRTTFQAIPGRASVLIAKAGLIGAFGAVLSFVLMLGAVFITKAAAGTEGSTNLALDNADAWRAVYGVPIFAFLCVVLAIAVGALLRQSAGAIALLLLWPLLIESLFGMFDPSVETSHRSSRSPTPTTSFLRVRAPIFIGALGKPVLLRRICSGGFRNQHRRRQQARRLTEHHDWPYRRWFRYGQFLVATTEVHNLG